MPTPDRRACYRAFARRFCGRPPSRDVPAARLVRPEELARAEAALGFAFPASYRELLAEVGAGDTGALDDAWWAARGGRG